MPGGVDRSSCRVTPPLVSIVIPTLNGMQTLPAVLDAVAAQRADFAWEVMVIDSASDDGTAEWLRSRSVRVVPIPRDAFNHGLTRNRAIADARGELIVLLSQDAIPANGDWLAELVAPLRARAVVAGTFARQVPHDNAGPIARFYLERWLANSVEPRSVRLAGADAFERLDPVSRFDACIFDNVCSCIRRSAWTEHPFRETPIAEDVEWARDVLLAGYELAFAPRAVVRHSHERSPAYEFRRTFLLHQRLQVLFGLRTVPSVPALLRAVAASSLLHLRLVRGRRDGRDGISRALSLALVWPLGQFLGGLTGARGRRSRASRHV